MFIPSLTAIRGFAALWVALLHLRYADSAKAYGFFAPIFERGYLGVPIFFVLSGFILAHVHRRDFGADLSFYLRFMWLRFCRVYPLHLITLISAVFILARGPEDTLFSFVLNLLMLHAWGAVTGVTWNFPSWSISTEWFAYLLFPLAAFAVRSCGWRANLALAILCLGAYIFVLPLVAGFDNGVSLIAFFLLFLLGFSAQGVADDLPSGPWGTVAVSCMVGFVALAYLPAAAERYVMPSLSAVLVVALYRANSILSWRPLVYFGEISYALYLSHILAFTVLRMPFGGVPQNLGLEIVVCIAAAMALHHLDMPIGRWLRGIWRRDYRSGTNGSAASPSLIK
jgi:peptidoglycan/LPS O-acetylase OafA/YrhL